MFWDIQNRGFQSGNLSALIGRFSAKDLEVIQEQNELDDDQDGCDNQASVVDTVAEYEPDQQARGNQEENGSYQGNDLFQLVRSERQKVQDKEDYVHNHEDKIQTRCEAD